MKSNYTMLLSPDNVTGSPVILKVGDNVSWTHEGKDYEGTIEAVEDTTLVVKDSTDEKKYRIPKDEAELVVPEGEKVLEIKDGIKFIELKYRAEKNPNPKNVNLAGYTFAVPRFENIPDLLKHVNARLKEQNKHKDQDPDKGVTAEDVVLDNFNSMVANKLRTRVKNEMQELFEKKGKEWNTGLANLLFNVQQAFSWIPGIREPGSAALIKVLSGKIMALQAAGKCDFFEADGKTPTEFHKLMKELAAIASGQNKVQPATAEPTQAAA